MMRSRLIAIVGSIGSGKTTLLNGLGRDFPVYNADILAKEVLETKRSELVARYGPDICLPNRTQDEIGYSEQSCEQKCELNKEMLAGILFQENENLASEERKWIAELVNDDVLSLILSYSERLEQKIILVEITAPTSKVLQSFDGVIVISTDEETAIRRTNDRKSAWSEERRRKIYRMQMEEISKYIGDVLADGAEEIACFASEMHRSPSNVAPSEISSETSKFVLRVDNSDSEDALKKTARNIVSFLKKEKRQMTTIGEFNE